MNEIRYMKLKNYISILVYSVEEEDINLILHDKDGTYCLPSIEVPCHGLWDYTAFHFAESILSSINFQPKDMKRIYQLQSFVPSLNNSFYHYVFLIRIENVVKQLTPPNDITTYVVMPRKIINERLNRCFERIKMLELINLICTNKTTDMVETQFEHLDPKCIDVFKSEGNKTSTLLSRLSSGSDLTDLYEEFVTRCHPYSTLVLTDVYDLFSQCGWTGQESLYFRTLDWGGKGELDLKDFLVGLSCMDPLTPHGDITGELRCKYIFRMYDQNCDNCLDVGDIKEMVKDIAKTQPKSECNEDSININLQNALKIFNMKSTDKLSLDNFLQAVGSLKFRGTSLLLRASNSISIILMKIRRRKTKRLRSVSESSLSGPINKKAAIGVINGIGNILSDKPPLKKKNQESNYSLAEHTVKVRGTGYISEIDNLIDMERAGILCNTGLDSDDPFSLEHSEVLSNLGVTIITSSESMKSSEDLTTTSNYRKRVSKQFSAQAFNNKSMPNEILIALKYFEAKGKDKPPYNWGEVDMMKMGRCIISLCDFLQDILEQEPRMLSVPPPCYVLGDLHGNYEDLMCFEKTLWKLGPHLTPATFLFLGDYVDRGAYGVEVVAYLFAQKLRAPAHFLLLRGNHEVRDLQKNFTFYNECISKFGESLGEVVWDKINNVFDRMPLSAVVGKKIFCMHGGIPFLQENMNQLQDIPCPLPCPESQCNVAWQLMWNDPLAQVDICEDINQQLVENGGFASNRRRQTGYVFNEEAFDKFLTDNKLSHVIRAHEVKEAGFEIQQSGRLLTVFSSSHYCGGNNEAACMLINDYRIRILRLDTSP